MQRLGIAAARVGAVWAGLFAFTAEAANGLNLIGFGAESVAMAGADTAVARDTSALNTNPAGLGQLTRPAFDGYLAAAFSLDVGHSDSLGNNRQVDNRVVPLGGFGLSRPFAGGQGVLALGLFAQGGAGAVYKSLRTPFGTDDELSGLIGIVRVTPGIAWRVNDELTLGAAAPLNAIMVKQRVFPGTSVFNANNPAQSFFGLKLDGVRGAHVGLRLGAMWKPAAEWSFGAIYSPRIKLDAKRGDAEVNFSALGLGVVPYRNARIEGLALAREIALGVAWQATARTLLSLKLAHLDWSNALRSVTVTVSEPADAAAPARISQTSRVDWRDQTVSAAGVAHALSDKLTAYAGFNHARNPTPSETLTPLLAAIGTRHATTGFAYRLDEGWLASAALEYQFRNRVVYSNPNIPLGAQAEERSRYVALNFMVSRRW
jgi:long-chain fatty acid transport protein